MQHRATSTLALLALVALPVHVAGDGMSPIEKVIELFSNLQAQVVSDGEAEEAAYKDYYQWCEDATRQLAHEIETLTNEKGKLEAAIEKASSDIEVAQTRIDEISSQVAEDESSLKEATTIRKKERSEFEAAETALTTAVDMLGRAVNVLEREMQGGAALVQAAVGTEDLSSVLAGVAAVVDAASFSAADKERVAALIEAQADAEDTGAPTAANYKSHSGGIVEVLEDMQEKAETQLGDLRKSESKAQHNFDLLKQSLEDAAATGDKDLKAQKDGLAKAKEEQATADGDLAVTKKSLEEAKESLARTRGDCMQKASDHDVTVQGRKEELEALTKAKKIIQASTSGVAFLQVRASTSAATTTLPARGREILNLVGAIARRERSASLVELGSRIAAVLRYGRRGGADPFAKVKGLISDMIAKLTKEAGEEAAEKAFCDKEMKKTKDQKSDLEDEVTDLTVKIDKSASASTKAKEQVATLQAELAELAKLQSQLDKTRDDQHASFVHSKKDLTEGLTGIRGALTLLRDYYGGGKEESEALLQDTSDTDLSALMQQPAPPEKHEKSSGAGGSIIGLLEVIESDLAKNLAQEETEEADAQENYEKMTQENKVTKTQKEQDAKYKTKDFKALDKKITMLSSDRATSQTELDAVNEYWAKLTDRCVAKPETYEERKARREAEIEGLKQAMGILEGEAVFAQTSRGGLRRALRGQ